MADALNASRDKWERDDMALVRVEQLYPFMEIELREALAAYSDESRSR